MLKPRISVAFWGAMLAAVNTANAGGDSERGKTLYESRCIACHSVDANRVGPLHRGVLGRKAGGVSDYDYSAAVKNSPIVWNETTLDRWLANPEGLIPGQKMGYRVSEPNDRRDIIAFLRKQVQNSN